MTERRRGADWDTSAPFDWSHYSARTEYHWDGCFRALCPHGKDVEWHADFGKDPKPRCKCRKVK